MNILAFDTSLNKTYIALESNGKIFEKVVESDEKNYHSVYLIEEIGKIIENAGIELKELDLIASNVGPGSFTGIRVGLTVARTIAKELNLKVFGANSLEILRESYKNFAEDEGGPKSGGLNPGNACPDVVLDARRGQFFVNTETGVHGVNYDDIRLFLKSNLVICDTTSFQRLKDPSKPLVEGDITLINFEQCPKNLALTLLKLAKDAVYGDFYGLNPCAPRNRTEIANENLRQLAWSGLKPMYVQGPPIHKKISGEK